MGTLATVVVVFLILALVTQAAGYYRKRWSVADSPVSGDGAVATSAAVGLGAGIAVLVLLLLLYLGLTRWDWVGTPATGASPVVLTPAASARIST